ncbi:hypothetical protein ACNOYE_11505 [Nannocystaceae bacterium ST9]
MADLTSCVFDTSVVVNFIHVARLDLLGSANDIAGHLPEEVDAEVTHAEQRARLDVALAQGHLQIVRLESLDELALYGMLRERYGRGESAALALASVRAMHLACDEGRSFRTTILSHLGPGRHLNTPTLLLRAIRRGVISIGEADTYKIILEGRRFRMRFASFQDLINPRPPRT